LLEHAHTDWTDVPHFWHHLYRLARPAHDNGSMEDADWNRVCELIDEHAPEVRGLFESQRAAALRAEQEYEQEVQEMEREQPQTKPISDVVERVLASDSLSAGDRMRQLAGLCLVPELRPAHVIGNSNDLPLDMRARVQTVIREGLEQATPTPLAEGNSFPAALLCEARAFLSLLEEPDQEAWLTPERIRLWFPAAVLTLHDRIPYLVRRCAAVDREATLTILLHGAERELRAGFEFAVRAREIPLE
jgi:hypothetical protein